MQPSEALDVAAQVSVTLAGFAGIVFVFRPEAIQQWSRLDRLRLQLLLFNSALPLCDALFGILLLTVERPPNSIWRWCSGFALATQIAFVSSTGRATRNVPAAERGAVNKPLYYSLTVVGSIAMVLQLFNLAMWNLFWPFFAAIFVHLIAAILQFVRMVLLPHGSANAPS